MLMQPLVMDGVRAGVVAPRLQPATVPTVKPLASRKRPSLAALLTMALVAPILVVATTTLAYWPRHVQVADISSGIARAAEKPAPVPAVATAPAPAPTDPAQEETAKLQALISQFSGGSSNWGVVVKNLKTDATASTNPDETMDSASLYKLFVANQLLRLSDQGKLNLDAASPVSGRTFRSCVEVMINISDNTCGSALISYLGYGKQNADLASQGYIHTNLKDLQKTSASDPALLLTKLYTGSSDLTPASQAVFMQFLKEQRVNNRLPQGLPFGTSIAHKTGDLFGYTHDVGIIYGPKTDYIVAVMSGPWGSPATSYAKFAQLSTQLWHFFED